MNCPLRETEIFNSAEKQKSLTAQSIYDSLLLSNNELVIEKSSKHKRIIIKNYHQVLGGVARQGERLLSGFEFNPRS